MKRRLLLIVVGILLVSGCSVPASKIADETPEKKTELLPAYNKQTAAKPEGETAGKGSTDAALTGGIRSPQTVYNIQESETPQEVKKSRDLLITLYYQDGDGLVVPVARRFERQEGIARAAIGALVDTSLNREELEYYGIYPVLPQGTEILGINIKQGTAFVDFSSKLLDYKDSLAERNIVSSVVYTLTEFASVNAVKFMVDGKELRKLKFGTDAAGALDRTNTLLNSTRVNLQNGLSKLDIYLAKYVNNIHLYILPVSVEYKKQEYEDVPAKAVELLRGKDYQGNLQTELPQGSKLLKSSISGNTLILDFDNQIRNYGGTTREDIILKQLLFTMKQFEGVKRIKILIDGKPGTLPEGTEITGELDIPPVINDFLSKDL